MEPKLGGAVWCCFVVLRLNLSGGRVWYMFGILRGVRTKETSMAQSTVYWILSRLEVYVDGSLLSLLPCPLFSRHLRSPCTGIYRWAQQLSFETGSVRNRQSERADVAGTMAILLYFRARMGVEGLKNSMDLIYCLTRVVWGE